MIKYFKLAIMRKKARETWILYHEVKETEEHLIFGIFFFIYTDVKLYRCKCYPPGWFVHLYYNIYISVLSWSSHSISPPH